MKSAFLSILVVGILGAACSLALAKGRRPAMPTKAPKFSSWAAYWDGARARQAMFTSASQLEEVEIFAYHFGQEDALVPAQSSVKELEEAFSQLPDHKPRLAITLVNDVESDGGVRLKDPGCVHRVVFTAAAREAHIQQILVIAQQAESIDVDYERIAPEDGQAFTAFIQALATALHQNGKRLSVVVEPRISDGGPLAWKDIAQSADQLTVMAYLYHYGTSGPGSIAPIDWVHQIAAYGLRDVPAEKLSIALHLGGYDWPKTGPGKSLEYDKAEALASAYGTSIQLDSKTQSGHFSYTDASGPHEVWIETAAGLKKKIESLRAAGIFHIALWRLGAGDPAFWDGLNKM